MTNVRAITGTWEGDPFVGKHLVTSWCLSRTARGGFYYLCQQLSCAAGSDDLFTASLDLGFS